MALIDENEHLKAKVELVKAITVGVQMVVLGMMVGGLVGLAYIIAHWR
jgi:hypothetical protein